MGFYTSIITVQVHEVEKAIGRDLDLANSGWLVTTAGHLVIVPILIFILF